MSEPLRKISNGKLRFIKTEAKHWVDEGLINESQSMGIIGRYEGTQFFTGILISFGMILLGLALLSYIAANWMTFQRITKIALIISVYVGLVAAAFLSEKTEKTENLSRGLMLLASFAYGGGIFLMAQVFNDGGNYADALLYWIIGIVPVFLLFKDKCQLILMNIIAVPYFCGSLNPMFPWNVSSFNIKMITDAQQQIAIVIMFWLFVLRAKDRVSFNTNMLISIILVIFMLNKMSFSLVILLFCIGIVFAFVLSRVQDDLTAWGLILIFMCGMIMSWVEYWNSWFWHRPVLPEWIIYISQLRLIDPHLMLPVASGLISLTAMLFFIMKGHMLANVFFCIFVMRYYFDMFYDFTSKAVFFGAGGLILVLIGITMEKLRKASLKKAKAVQEGGSNS